MRRLLVTLFVTASALVGPMADPGRAATFALTIDSVEHQSSDQLLVHGSISCFSNQRFRVELSLSQERGGKVTTGFGYVAQDCGEETEYQPFAIAVDRTSGSKTKFRRGPATVSVGGYVLTHNEDFPDEDSTDPLSGTYRVRVR